MKRVITPYTLVTATDLHLILRSKPEELQSITLADRVGQMEDKNDANARSHG